MAIASVLEYKKALTDSGLNLDYLIDNFKVIETRVERTLPDCSNITRFHYKKEKEDGGYVEHQLWSPTCSGVSMDFKLYHNNFEDEKTDTLHGTAFEIPKTRLSQTALPWNGFKL